MIILIKLLILIYLMIGILIARSNYNYLRAIIIKRDSGYKLNTKELTLLAMYDAVIIDRSVLKFSISYICTFIFLWLPLYIRYLK